MQRKQEVTDNMSPMWHLHKAFHLPPYFAQCIPALLAFSKYVIDSYPVREEKYFCSYSLVALGKKSFCYSVHSP